MKFTTARWFGVLRVLLAAGSPFLLFFGASGPLTKVLLAYGMSADKIAAWNDVIVAVLSIASVIVLALWSASDNSPTNTTLEVAKLPGVEVHVDTSPSSPAPPEIQNLAKDIEVSNVKPAA